MLVPDAVRYRMHKLLGRVRRVHYTQNKTAIERVSIRFKKQLYSIHNKHGKFGFQGLHAKAAFMNIKLNLSEHSYNWYFMLQNERC